MIGLEAVGRAIAHAEAGLRAPLAVSALADAAGYSLYHFCRLFGRYTRLSPHTYIVRRRLTLAAEDVVVSSRRVVDIAHDHGFDSHEGFTRAFRRLFGVSPTQARTRGAVAAAPRLPPLSPGHLRCLERHAGLRPEAPGTRPHGAASTQTWAVPLTWPAEPVVPVVARSGAPASRVEPAPTETVTFRLVGAGDDLPLVLDWLVHGWLVAEQRELAVPEVRIVRTDSVRVVLEVSARQRDAEAFSSGWRRK